MEWLERLLFRTQVAPPSLLLYRESSRSRRCDQIASWRTRGPGVLLQNSHFFVSGFHFPFFDSHKSSSAELPESEPGSMMFSSPNSLARSSPLI